jgi:hypothetical protein
MLLIDGIHTLTNVIIVDLTQVDLIMWVASFHEVTTIVVA